MPFHVSFTVPFSIGEAERLCRIVADLGISRADYLRLIMREHADTVLFTDAARGPGRRKVLSFGIYYDEQLEIRADARARGFSDMSAYVRALHAAYVRVHAIPASGEPPEPVARLRTVPVRVIKVQLELEPAVLPRVNKAAALDGVTAESWLTTTLLGALTRAGV